MPTWLWVKCGGSSGPLFCMMQSANWGYLLRTTSAVTQFAEVGKPCQVSTADSLDMLSSEIRRRQRRVPVFQASYHSLQVAVPAKLPGFQMSSQHVQVWPYHCTQSSIGAPAASVDCNTLSYSSCAEPDSPLWLILHPAGYRITCPCIALKGLQQLNHRCVRPGSCLHTL